MLALARAAAGQRLPTGSIQQETRVPMAFLQRIVATLRRAGLLRAYPGVHGGLQLARPAAEISLLEVHEAVEGPILISECLAAPDTCPLAGPCPVRERWGRLDALIKSELAATTLQQLALAPASPGRRAASRSRRPEPR